MSNPTKEIARALALASVGANAEAAVCDAAGARIEHRGYYLLWPDAEPTPDRKEKYPYFRAAWYDRPHRQRRTRSTRQRSLVEAWEFLIDYADNNPLARGVVPFVRVDADVLLSDAVAIVEPIVQQLAEQAKNAKAWKTHSIKRADDLPLKIVMAIYYASRKTDMANPDSIKYALQAAVEVWGDDVTVRMLEGPAQHAFIASRRALLDEHGVRANADWTIVSYISVMWSAMRYCVNVAGVLAKDAVQGRISTADWRPRAVLPKRKLRGFGMKEMALFLQAAHLRERWWRATLINLGLGPRPGAAQDLQSANVDLETQTVDLLAVDEKGQFAVQNGVKNRATVKIGATMCAWFGFWNEALRPSRQAAQYVTFMGAQMASFGWVHSVARHAGVKIPKGMGAYLFRHFVARYLASHGCPADQIKALLGHEIADGATTFYVELEPWFLQKAAELIQQMLQELDELLPENMTLLIPHSIEDVPLRHVSPDLPMSVWQPLPESLNFSWEAVRERSVWVPDPLPRTRGTLVAVTAAESQDFKLLEAPGATCERSLD